MYDWRASQDHKIPQDTGAVEQAEGRTSGVRRDDGVKVDGWVLEIMWPVASATLRRYEKRFPSSLEKGQFSATIYVPYSNAFI